MNINKSMNYSVGLTGSTGSLGKIILKKFQKQKIFTFKGDIRDREKILRWVKEKKIDTIIHLAAVVPIKVVNKNRKLAKEINLNGTKNEVVFKLAHTKSDELVYWHLDGKFMGKKR